MTALIKQSATAVNLRFLLVLTSDHITGATGITPTVTISKNGAAFAAPSGAVTEISGGWYKIAGNATDTNTLGPIDIHATGTGCDPTDVMNAAMVVAFDPQDAVRFGLTALPNAAASAVGGLPVAVDTSGRVDVLKINGTSQTARDIGASVLLSAGTGAGQLDFTSGVIKANLAQILGTALTETAGQLAAAFKKFFNIATPASTMDALTLVATATNVTNSPTVGDFTATMKTSLNAATPVATLSGDLTPTMKTSVTTAATAATPTAAAVTARVTANTDQLAGQAVTAAAGVTFPTSVASPTNITVASGVALTAAYDAAKTAAQPSDVPSASTVAAAVQASATATPLASNVKKINGVTINGTGVLGDPWGP